MVKPPHADAYGGVVSLLQMVRGPMMNFMRNIVEPTRPVAHKTATQSHSTVASVGDAISSMTLPRAYPVSYTHLTLPTILLV